MSIKLKIGFTIGKFAPLHKGHQYLIEKGLSEMDEFYVIVYDTNVITIPTEKRANWIKEIYPKAKNNICKKSAITIWLRWKKCKNPNRLYKKIS